MSPELTQKLVEKYPKLFSSKQFCGFECGDGWFDLLDYLCGSLLTYTYGDEEIYVDQVKEKFGRLRFYLSKEDDVMHGMVSMAEHMSGRICETCGERGETRGGSWMVTLCDLHHDERIARLAE